MRQDMCQGMRYACVTRQTTETDINICLNLEANPKTGPQVEVATGYGLADHMLNLLAFWAGFDLKLSCKGDLHIDAHHSLEDTAFCLGQALLEALGERKGIARVGYARVPMDEALAEVSVDISGRPYLVYRGNELLPPMLGGEESDVWREFFRAFSAGARLNLHIEYRYGLNGHHLLESAYKGLGLALKQAVALSGNNILSTKGSLD